LGSSSISEAGEDVMKVFGADLEQVLINERIAQNSTSTGVPSVVEVCLKYLIPNYTQEEGLFRISGMREEVMAHKEKVDLAAAQASVYRIEESELNCHNISGLLKLYIRELPSPLYPKEVHAELIAASQIENADLRKESLVSISKRLPDASFALLKRLTCVLNDLLANVEHTKMTAANLSTVWAPNLIWDRDMETDPTTCLAFSRDVNLAIQYTIEHAYDMFQADVKVSTSTEAPKRRSVFDLEPELVHASSHTTSSSMDTDDMTASSSSSSSSTMDVSSIPPLSLLGSETPDNLTPRDAISRTLSSSSSSAMTPVTPQSPGFEDMLALATTSCRKRPRSIWVGSAAALNEEMMMESAEGGAVSPTTNATSAVSLSKPHRASSKRKSRVSTLLAPSASIISSISESSTAEGAASESEPSAKRRKAAGMELNNGSDEAIHQLDASAPVIPVIDLATATTASPRKSSIRSSIRKSLRLGGRGSRASVVGGPSSSSSSASSSATSPREMPDVMLYYYMDSDPSSVALRKLLASMHLIPREIRNAQNDPMSVEEVIFFAKTCSDLVVVRRSDKPYTTSHKLSDLSTDELRSALTNASGEPRSPAILVGSTYIVGYDKQLKDIFRYYMHRTKKSPTPLKV
jgi:hypothetical protein